MTTAVREMHEREVQPLPAADRLDLAKLILAEMPTASDVDFSDDWSEEDMREATAYCAQRILASVGAPPTVVLARRRCGGAVPRRSPASAVCIPVEFPDTRSGRRSSPLYLPSRNVPGVSWSLLRRYPGLVP